MRWPSVIQLGGFTEWRAPILVKRTPFWSCSPFQLHVTFIAFLTCLFSLNSSHFPFQGASQNGAAAVAFCTTLLLLLGMENGQDCFIEDSLKAFLCERWALQVALCSDLLSQLHSVLVGEWFLLHVKQPSQSFGIISKINLCSYEDVRHIGHADFQLGDPLLLDVVVRGRVHHREADQEHVRVGVGQGSQLVVVLLPCSVVKSQQVLLSSHSHSYCVVVKHGGHVLLREGVVGIAHQQTGFPNRAIPNHHAF